MHPIRPEPTRPGQESVWDFPRPAIVEPTSAHIVIRVGAVIVADTRRAMRTLETSHPPSYYIPLEDIAPGTLVPAEGSSFCEWKGHARYFDVIADRERRERAAWSYPDPTPPFAILRDHVAFYAAAMDACFVDGEQVVAQPGGFYGGWITSAVAGPFKGVPGSRFW
ncbi:DUF427 domain-containing protein [Glacieibacterium megasporae]|uniref:DUF427 domain-containing protein n=1 Tax=Glacieibacterium megasporae TaxID=2835787 RepID=UPI001C1E74A7|nr:DUF427 domain-containing protein [Polymorphobacter megasporae]UAJ08900.1 DUF427 domain-containing protein [Polymorphobacter megasporae]